MGSTREFILTRLARVLRDVRPGAAFTLPDSAPGAHRPIVSNLRSVHTRFVDPESEGGTDLMPYGCVVAAPGQEDTRTVMDEQLYGVSTPVQVVVWAAQKDETDAIESDARATLEELRADLAIAVESFPFWTGPDAGEEVAAVERVGHIATVLDRHEIIVPIYQPYGELTMTYRVGWVESIALG